MDELTRFKIAEHKLSLLTPIHNKKDEEFREITYRYAHGCGNSCEYIYPYLYVRIYISGGIMVHGCGYQDFEGHPLISKRFRIYTPELGEKYDSWEDSMKIRDHLLSENNIYWVRGRGYLHDAPFEDYTTEYKSRCRIRENLMNQEIKELDKKYEESEREFRFWRDIWNESYLRLNDEFAKTQPFNIGTIPEPRLVDVSQVPGL